ncbi:MAG: alpha/beta fold hydrolase [bacterium]
MSTAVQSIAGSNKRTIVRSTPLSARGVRLWFRVISALAPATAERQAAVIFLTPRRRKAHDVMAVPEGANRVHMNYGGFRLVGWEWGVGIKPVVLLVHGWSGLAKDMESLAHALVDEGFRAVAFDMPAHGKSPGRRTSMLEWVHALKATEHWAGGLAGVLGHSFGATAVTLALEEGMQAPRALLMSPAPGPMHYVDKIRRFIGLPASRVPGMVRSLERQVGRAIPHFEGARAAKSLKLPVLVLHDPEDSEVPWEHVQDMIGAWRGSRLETRPGLGHYRILADKPTSDVAAAFLAGRT